MWSEYRSIRHSYNIPSLPTIIAGKAEAKHDYNEDLRA
jgi:hypothetical protein